MIVKDPPRKSLFFIFFNMRIKIIPKYSRAADISKTVSELNIREKQLWSWERIFSFLSRTQHPFRHVVRESLQIRWKCVEINNFLHSSSLMSALSKMSNGFEIGHKMWTLEQYEAFLCNGGIIRCYLNANFNDKLSF